MSDAPSGDPPTPLSSDRGQGSALSGLVALCRISGFHQRPVDPWQLQQALGLEGAVIGHRELLLAAAELGLKARETQCTWQDLGRLGLPAVAELKDGRYTVVGRRTPDDRIPVTFPSESTPRLFTEHEWSELASGWYLLVRDRLRLSDGAGRFGFSWFLPILWKYRSALVEILAAALVFQLLMLSMPLFTQVVIDKVLVHHSLSTLDVVAAGMLLVTVLDSVFSVLRQWLLAHTGNRIDVLLGSALYRHLIRVPLRYFMQRRVGDTVARVREVERIRSFLTGPALLSMVDALFVVIFIGVLLLYSAKLTLVVLVTIGLLAGLSAILNPVLRQRVAERFDVGADHQSFLVESVGGVETIKAMSLEATMIQRFDMVLSRYVAAAYRVDWISGLSGGVGQGLQQISTLVILYFGAREVMAGRLSVGQLIAFQMIARQAIAPVLRITQLWQNLQQTALSVERVGDLMNTPPEPSLQAGKTALPVVRGHIRLDKVTFRYRPDGVPILDQVDVDIQAGTTVGIVGRSGSGKSTLAKLIQRLYLPESGRILLDAVDIGQVNLTALRRHIAVVPQESFLFRGSVRDNIAIQTPAAPIERIMDVARNAGAHDFIMELPDGYDTVIGERGATLSGGQRQRLAIARALFGNPRILILDEATSALDYESERIIQNNLAQIRKGRTVIIIAHRLSTVRDADRIFVLEKGSIVEQGRHVDLLNQGGPYAHLFRQQGAAS
ncbi:MAG: peptidase domain-containing ABC transporter [Acidiferrobacteraceae bacterium]